MPMVWPLPADTAVSACAAVAPMVSAAAAIAAAVMILAISWRVIFDSWIMMFPATTKTLWPSGIRLLSRPCPPQQPPDLRVLVTAERWAPPRETPDAEEPPGF